MSTELEIHRPTNTLAEQMDYARAVSTGSLLPQSYRDSPANVLIAVGLGSAMGLSPAESLYRIDVIQGKPTASAELIAANVRKAGHKLRVRGDDTSCTATVIRADDPDFEFTVTRDVTWAQAMGLASKENYKKQPGTMLQWRAISAVARLACPEALYGVAYTPDEMYDDRGTVTVAASGLGAALNPPADNTETAVDRSAAAGTQAGTEPLPPITAPQLKKLHTMLSKVGLGGDEKRDDQLAYYARVTGTVVESSKDLTKDEAKLIIDDLENAEKGDPSVFVEWTDEPEPGPPLVTAAQVTQIRVCLANLGVKDWDKGMNMVAGYAGRTVKSTKHLSKAEASRCIDGLEAALEARDAS